MAGRCAQEGKNHQADDGGEPDDEGYAVEKREQLVHGVPVTRQGRLVRVLLCVLLCGGRVKLVGIRYRS